MKTKSNEQQTEISAILIQKLWRGHQARLKFRAAAKVLQSQRTQNYIEYDLQTNDRNNIF